MKEAIFIGNCQCSGIIKLLEYTNFNEKYKYAKFANWEMIENNNAPPIEFLKTADIVIYQPLSDVHGCFSTNPENKNNMLSFCKEDSIKISFPRIHNNSLWPIFKKHKYKSLYYGDNFLDYYKNQNINTKDSFIKIYDDGLFDFKFEERYNKNNEIFKQKEESCDIKVLDYIIENIQKYNLFLTQDHPTSRIFHHCVCQILDVLDINFIQDFDIDILNDNITGLSDSIYDLNTNRYPNSSYSKNHFNYVYEQKIDDYFYKNNLVQYLNLNGI